MIRPTKNADTEVLKALEYLVKVKSGYLDDLKANPNFTNVRIMEFCSVGIMRTGWTNHKQTWRVLPFGVEYYNVVRDDKSKIATLIASLQR